MKYFLILLVLLSGCAIDNTDCDLLTINVDPAEIIYKPEPNVQVRMLATSYLKSHAHFKCNAWWEGPPLSDDSPTGLIAELCVGGKCEKALGRVAEVMIWADKWDELRHYDAAYCVVYMPAWDRMELQPDGQIIVVESFEEKVIARVRYPLQLECKATEAPDSYCIDGYYGVEGWTCTQWS